MLFMPAECKTARLAAGPSCMMLYWSGRRASLDQCLSGFVVALISRLRPIKSHFSLWCAELHSAESSTIVSCVTPMHKSPTLTRLDAVLQEQALAIAALRADANVQFKRIADMQAELDVLPQARRRRQVLSAAFQRPHNRHVTH
jgi:hypothetical protein